MAAHLIQLPMDQNDDLREIRVLPFNEVKILRIIRINGPEWNRFTAYLPYLRAFDRDRFDREKGYDKGDSLDTELLSSIQQMHPGATLYRNSLILFTGQLEDELKRIQGGVDKSANIRFTPQVVYNSSDDIYKLAGKTFPVREIVLRMRVLLSHDDERLSSIYSDFICPLPHELLVKLWSTIQAV